MHPHFLAPLLTRMYPWPCTITLTKLNAEQDVHTVRVREWQHVAEKDEGNKCIRETAYALKERRTVHTKKQAEARRRPHGLLVSALCERRPLTVDL